MKDWWKPLLLWLALLLPVLLLTTADRWADVNWKKPGQLAWLLVLPPMVVFLLFSLWRRDRLMALFIESRLFDDLAARVGRRRLWVRMGLILLAVAGVIFALARPRWDVEKIKSTQSNLDIIVAIDVSKSMLSADLDPSRLDHAKLAAKELKRHAQTERLGIIYFAGGASVKCTLTSDEESFRSEIDHTWVKNAQSQEEGTSLAKLIRTANTAFVAYPGRQKALVIFTDGEDHEGEALKAAQDAKADGMVIFTVGVGSAAGGVIGYRDCPDHRCLVINPLGRTECERCGTRLMDAVYLKDESGKNVHSRLNEGMLKEIAAEANGRYLPLRGTTAMATLYNNWLAPLAQPDDTGAVNKEIAREQYRWPLGAAMLLLLVEMFIPGHRRRKQAAGGVAGVAMLAGLLCLAPSALAAWPLGIDRLWRSSDPAEKPEIDPQARHAHRLFFNRGNEFYRKAVDDFAPVKEPHGEILLLWDLNRQIQLENKEAARALIRQLEQKPRQSRIDLTALARTIGDGDATAIQAQAGKIGIAIKTLMPKVKPAVEKSRKGFNRALGQYTLALEAEELPVQQQAFYNIGNTHYRLGQQELERKARIQEWVKSAEHLRAASKLDRGDRDAARNLAFVEKKLREELAKLPMFRDQMEVDMVNRLKKQKDAVALRIFPPSKESLPERPYWRMVVFDGYRGGVGYTSRSLTQLESAARIGGHESWHGNRPVPEGMRMDGADWRFHFEPLVASHLPLPGPFERLILHSAKPYHYSEDAFYGRLADMPTKLVRYHVVSPADTQFIEPAKADRALLAEPPAGATGYPWTTLEVNLSRDEKRDLQAIVDQVTEGKAMTAEQFTGAAVKFLQDHHAYEMMQIPKDQQHDPVLAWLKTEKPGHCEYFAYGFQLLARQADFPTRVVCGLAGVEFDKVEGTHVSRFSMAHAWAEIFDGTRWVRVEATPPEPDRKEGGDGDPQEGNNGEPQLTNSPRDQQPNQGGTQQLSLSEALELLEAARDQEKPLSDALEQMERMGRRMGLDRWTNERLLRGRKRKNW